MSSADDTARFWAEENPNIYDECPCYQYQSTAEIDCIKRSGCSSGTNLPISTTTGRTFVDSGFATCCFSELFLAI